MKIEGEVMGDSEPPVLFVVPGAYERLEVSAGSLR